MLHGFLSYIALYFADTSLRQEGGLQDVAIEIIHLLVTNLVRSKDNFGIGTDQKEAFLKTLRKGGRVFYLIVDTKGTRQSLLCRLRIIAAHRDHFVRRLSVRPSVCLSGSHTFLVVTHSYVLQATHAFLRMLPLCFLCCCFNRLSIQCDWMLQMFSLLPGLKWNTWNLCLNIPSSCKKQTYT